MPYYKFFGMIAIFGLYTSWLYFLLYQIHNPGVYFPRDLAQLKDVTAAVKNTQKDHFGLVLLLFCSAYIYKQTFAIPGSFFTNILAGAIYGSWFGFPLVCILSATGATCCFLLSKYLGHNFLRRHFPNRVASWEHSVSENSDSLFYFLLSSRMFPGSPNWAINICSPIIGVPIVPFYFSVLFGLIPYNFICVHAGEMLSTINSLDSLFSWSTIFGMLLIAVVAAIPGILLQQRKLRRR